VSGLPLKFDILKVESKTRWRKPELGFAPFLLGGKKDQGRKMRELLKRQVSGREKAGLSTVLPLPFPSGRGSSGRDDKAVFSLPT